MPYVKAPALPLSARQQTILEQIVRRSTSIQQHVTRARLILLAADGFGNMEIAERLGINRKTVYNWRTNWLNAQELLAAVEAEGDEKSLYTTMLKILSDDHRSGAPVKFSAEVVCKIVAVSCEAPEEYGHPISHWTPRALRREVIKQKIVPDISVRQIGRFLKRGGSETASGPVLGKSRSR
jgi:putative transposase